MPKSSSVSPARIIHHSFVKPKSDVIVPQPQCIPFSILRFPSSPFAAITKGVLCCTACICNLYVESAEVCVVRSRYGDFLVTSPNQFGFFFKKT